MTLLRGHFAMMLVCAGDGQRRRASSAALAPLTADGDARRHRARGARGAGAGPTDGTSWVLTVHGGDRPGIVSSVVGEVAAVGGNITDLTTRLVGRPLPAGRRDRPAGRRPTSRRSRPSIKAAAAALGVGATLRPAEADDL